jgi:uncharacterized flavoprotein (TIGR03862 family)
MAADALAGQGIQVDLFDTMPSVGRKFLLAGKGGLNLTHSEPLPRFLNRFGDREALLSPWMDVFGPDAVRAWSEGLGQPTFVGSSGRVFPTDMKAAPLLRVWLHRLRAAGVRFHMRHRWLGWEAGGGEGAGLRFSGPQGDETVQHADAVVLALGGGSWPRLGSDGHWVPLLQARGVEVAALRPANCGFDVGRVQPDGQVVPGWTEHFRSRWAGEPLKSVAVSVESPDGGVLQQPGEFVVTEAGVEGSLVYAVSAALRDTLEATGEATLFIDLLPARSLDWVADELARPRGPRSLSTHLKSRLGLHGVKAGLLHELLDRERVHGDPRQLAASIKRLPLRLLAPRPLAEAISSAGGVRFDALDDGLMLRGLPGVHCAGEMIDWEAPTGGYLLTACLASGRVAGLAAAARLNRGR